MSPAGNIFLPGKHLSSYVYFLMRSVICSLLVITKIAVLRLFEYSSPVSSLTQIHTFVAEVLHVDIHTYSYT
jgi:hypothetical protein